MLLEAASVAPEVFLLRPDYRALLLTIRGITPRPSDATSEALLKKAEEGVQPVANIAHVLSWREAYKAFGAKPKKHKNSLEALTSRAARGLPRVNRLTDIYNAISVSSQIPFGGEDADKYSGAPRCIRATGKESFEVLTTVDGVKQTVLEHPDVGEVCWVDDEGVTCRRWNWRQGPRTALTDETTNTLFIMDALDPITEEQLGAAADELIAHLRQSDPDIVTQRRILKAPSS